jgi:Protein of unknown function (DUF742)
MSSGDEPESTFADVFNGLMGVNRPRKRPGRQAPEQPEPEAVALFEEAPREENAASVRAYAWTGGRTRTSSQLEIETLISTTTRAEELMHTMRSEHQSVARMCRQSRSVAEIGALLSLPLGVIRVLLDDMAGLGLVTVHTTQTTGDGQPDMDLLARVLRGLSNLRT